MQHNSVHLGHLRYYSEPYIQEKVWFGNSRVEVGWWVHVSMKNMSPSARATKLIGATDAHTMSPLYYLKSHG